MKKILLLLYSTFIIPNSSFSQGGVWTWMSGPTAAASNGVYGTQGVSSVNNFPPGMYEPAEWKDKQGNFWVYGGAYANCSDLWKYNPVTNEWTWVKGTGMQNQGIVCLTKGVPDVANSPGYRGYGAASWVDTTGNLWLFGGNPERNDLWKYDIATNEWTWLSGDTTLNASGVHGTQGIPSPANVPGARYEGCSAWTDSLNNLWLFSGEGFDDAGASGMLGDLMKYDISTNEWTWMKGGSTAGAVGNYGVKGVANASNAPDARWSYTKWKDLQGNFWLFGGYAGGTNSDMWKYNPGTNEWTWMAGPNVQNDAGTYTGNCVYDSLNSPASRYEQRAAVTDNCGRFWLCGGRHAGANFDYYNDLCVFDPAIAQWKWVSGSNVPNQAGSYGTRGVPSPANMTPSRMGAVAWWGNDDKFYLFGGCMNGGFNEHSDLWVFAPDTNCTGGSCLVVSVPAANFHSSDTAVCPGTCINYTNLSVNATSFEWSFSGGTPSTSTDANPQSICYEAPGQYDVTLIASNGTTNDTITFSNYITVYPAASPPTLTQVGDTLFAPQGFSTYQWYFGSDTIVGATNYFYIVPLSGNYNIAVTDSNGCAVAAGILNVISLAPDLSKGEGDGIRVFPNPARDELYVNCYFLNGREISFEVYNSIGEKVYNTISKEKEIEINTKNFSSGIYLLKIGYGEKIFTRKVLIEK